jgi:hypothetical protein
MYDLGDRIKGKGFQEVVIKIQESAQSVDGKGSRLDDSVAVV